MKCFYCDFTAFSGQRASVGRYLAALESEARRRAVPVDTLYVGGGTPSELSAAELETLCGALERSFGPIRALRESTVEANPESLDEAKLDALARAGITRLSLGLQTAEPRLLKAIGRRHDWADFTRVYHAARRRGFHLSVDLMFGLPEQSLADAERSLEAVIALAPDHVSSYGLQVEDRTLFSRRAVAVDEDLARAMFEATLERLAAAGYEHYEISNFARPGRQSVHNRIYWRNGEYVGLGCGAASFLGGERSENLDGLAAYCAAVEEGRSARAEGERLAPREALGETVFLGLRLREGLEWTSELEASFPQERRYIEARGWARLQADRLSLTPEGVFVANKVFSEFVAPFRSAAPEVRP